MESQVELEYSISIDGGKTAKGPMPLNQIKSMFRNNRISADSRIFITESNTWMLIAEFDPTLAHQRSISHDQLVEEIEESDRLAIKEERAAIWKGLLAFVLGSTITCFTYWAASDNPSGGMIIIAYGPISTGFIVFMYGLVSTIQRRRAQLNRGQNSPSA